MKTNFSKTLRIFYENDTQIAALWMQMTPPIHKKSCTLCISFLKSDVDEHKTFITFACARTC